MKARILFDGWPLAHEPGHPGALHLLELLEACPDWVEPWLALPAAAEPALLPDGIRIAEGGAGASDSPGARLGWEQMTLPALARRTSTRLLHLTHRSPPLACPVPVLLSPVDAWDAAPGEKSATPRPTLFARLREALGRGGLAAIQGLLWPEDLPPPAVNLPIKRLPPGVHPDFWHAQPLPAGLDLPETYIFCPGPLADGALEQLAAAWSWIAAGLGEEWALVVSDFTSRQADHLRGLCAERGIPLNLVALCDPHLEQATTLPHHPMKQHWTALAQRAAIFQRAGVVLSLGPVRPWGDSLLYALSSARPLAGWETPAAGARVGPAGYLAPPGDTRALGAAVVTLAVEEEVAQALAQAAQARSAAWRQDGFTIALSELYRQVIESRS